jgi:hypothetical protein
MKKLLWAIPLLIVLAMFATPAMSADVSFNIEWSPVTENVDGTPITDLKNYKFYVCDSAVKDNGTCDGNLKTMTSPKSGSGIVVDYTSSATNGSVFVRGSAVDEGGNESVLSNQIAFEFREDVPPNTIILRIRIP